MKASLEETARNSNRSVARVLEEIVSERLDAAGQSDEEEMDNQRRLHARVGRFAGRFSGTDPARGETAKARVRARLTGGRRTRVR